MNFMEFKVELPENSAGFPPIIISADNLLKASLYFVTLNQLHAKNRRGYPAVK